MQSTINFIVFQGYTVQEESDNIEDLGAGWQKERDAYERLCRGEVNMHPIAVARLTCHYQVKIGYSITFFQIFK